MTPQEWAEKLYYDLSFAAPEMHLTHIVNRIAQAMDDAAYVAEQDADALAEALRLVQMWTLSGHGISPIATVTSALAAHDERRR
jgi:hypothetical protein